MPKYIDQSVAIARLTHIEVTKPTATMTDAKRALADMFPADVESVVRCRDCRKFKTYGCRMVASGCDDFAHTVRERKMPHKTTKPNDK